MRQARHAQSHGQLLFCWCAVVIRLLLLLPSSQSLQYSWKYYCLSRKLLSNYVWIYVPKGVKNPLTWQELYCRSWFSSSLRTAWCCNHCNAKVAELNDGNLVFLFNVVVEIEREDVLYLQAIVCSPWFSLAYIERETKRIVHRWQFFCLRLNEISTKRDNKAAVCGKSFCCVRTAAIRLNAFCLVFSVFF